MTRIIKHIHSSGKFNGSNKTLFAAAKKYNGAADLVTYTEVEFERRENAVRKANGKTFGFVSGDKGNANDCAISYNSNFKLVYTEMFKATDKRIHMSKNKLRDELYSTIAIFDDIVNGKRLLVCTTHYASSVESDLDKKRYRAERAAQWMDSVPSSIKRANKLSRQYKCDGIIVCGDFNLNFKKKWARALIKSIAPKYSITWTYLPTGGTHGNRVIDATLIRKNKKLKLLSSAKLFEDDNSSDHRPYIEKFIWKD